MASKLSKEKTEKYQEIFLEIFRLTNVYVRTFKILKEQFPKIKIEWSYYYYYHWQYDQDFMNKITIIENQRKLLVEDKMMDMILNSNDASLIKFYLERKCNYKLQTEETINHNINTPIKISIVKPE